MSEGEAGDAMFGLLRAEEAAARLGVGIAKLATLERQGRLVPLRTKGSTGWRYYREGDVELLADYWAAVKLAADRGVRVRELETAMQAAREALR